MQKYVQEFLFVIVHSKGWYLKYLLVRRCNQIKSIVFPFFARWTLFKESLTVLFNWGLSPASDASERGPRRCCWRGHEGVPGGLIKWSDIQMFMLIFCSLPQLKTLSPTKPASHLARFLIWFYIWILNGDGDSRIEQAGKSNYKIPSRYHFVVFWISQFLSPTELAIVNLMFLLNSNTYVRIVKATTILNQTQIKALDA